MRVRTGEAGALVADQVEHARGDAAHTQVHRGARDRRRARRADPGLPRLSARARRCSTARCAARPRRSAARSPAASPTSGSAMARPRRAQFLETATSKREQPAQPRWVWLDATGHDAPRASAAELAPLDERRGRHAPRRDAAPAAHVHPRRGARGPRAAASRSRSRSSSSTATSATRCAAQLLGSVERRRDRRAARARPRRRVHRPADQRGSPRRRGASAPAISPGRCSSHQRDELGELATEINVMCERLAEERRAREHATEQLRHADRLTTVGKLASGLAHELGTPLNVVQRARQADRRSRGRGPGRRRLGADRRRAGRADDGADPPAARLRAAARRCTRRRST